MEIIDSNTMTIPLTQGKVAIVDAEDYEYLNQWKWYYAQGYAVRTECINGRQRQVLMHRVILERMGFKDFEDSDHINRNKIDNRRLNLRATTHQQNTCNRGKQTSNTSGYKGVYWSKQRKKWVARIYVDGKYVNLKGFINKKEAARVYNTAALMYHGEFAVLNEV